MQTCPIVFHDWHGVAVQAEQNWWIAPKQISDHLGLSWPAQSAKIRTSNLSKGMAIIAIPSAGGSQATTMLKRSYFGAWLLSIQVGKVAEARRQTVEVMQARLLDALDQQIAALFSMPGSLDIEDLIHLPMPAWFSEDGLIDTMWRVREVLLEDHQRFQAVRLARLGLAGTKIAAALDRSSYWARGQRREFVRLGLVAPTRREAERWLDAAANDDREPDLFTQGL